MRKNRKKILNFIAVIICLLIVGNTLETQAVSNRLKGKVYSWVKETWWTGNSSGGYDVKFTKTKVKYYSRKTGKVHHTAKIRGYKKIKGGYLIKIKYRKYKYCYTIYKKQKDTLEYYSGWKLDGEKYSGSSSLTKGKWWEE